MIPLLPKNGSVLKIVTYAQKQKGVHLYPSTLFSHKAERQRNVVTDAPDQDSGGWIQAQPSHLLPAAWAI